MQKYETCFRNRSRKCQIFHAVIKCYKNVTFYCLFIVLQIKFAMGAYGRTWAHFSTFAKMRPGRILFLVYSHMRPGRILALLIKCAHVLKRAPGRILALLIKCAHSALGRIGRIWAHMGAI